jgi:glutamyl-Q tRNA(Asp) synthetase
MEDLDTPRVHPEAADHILRTLDRFGFHWDGPVLYQSTRSAVYREALHALRDAGHAYPCGCSRKDAGDRYPGTCRNGLKPGRNARSWRVRVPAETIEFIDRVQGVQRQNPEEYCGDIVALRADGLFAYQLAVVIDDREQGVTDVVRGADLLDSTARQIHLQRLLGAPTPHYLHTPVAVNAHGQKLSKQTRAPAIEPAEAAPLIHDVLRFLGQHAPPSSIGSIPDLWHWAITNWRPEAIPRLTDARL